MKTKIEATHYTSVDEAKAAIETATNNAELRNYHAHGYVYQRGDLVGVLFHAEDRYLTAFLPDDATVLWHAEFRGYPDVSIRWEERGRHSMDDFDALADALGGGAAAALISGMDEVTGEKPNKGFDLAALLREYDESKKNKSR